VFDLDNEMIGDTTNKNMGNFSGKTPQENDIKSVN
jgi:hypothetical protein